MPDLLLELFSEEIPARMQTGAARDLERLMVGAMTDRGYLFEGIKTFSGPRRLTLAIAGLPAKQSDVREELKGPKIDAGKILQKGLEVAGKVGGKFQASGAAAKATAEPEAEADKPAEGGAAGAGSGSASESKK